MVISGPDATPSPRAFPDGSSPGASNGAHLVRWHCGAPSHDLEIAVWKGLASDTRKAGQSDLGGADHPDRLAALASSASHVSIHGEAKAPQQILAVRAGVGPEMKINVSI